MWIARLFSNFSLYLQMITHLLRTHLFMEPVAVACRRQLPSLHPLWKLLAPHVRGVMAINTLGRERLIPAGGVADNTLSLGGGGKSMRGGFLLPILKVSTLPYNGLKAQKNLCNCSCLPELVFIQCLLPAIILS